MRPLNSVEAKQAAEVAANDAAMEQTKAAKKVANGENVGKPKGLFSAFFEDEQL